MNDSLDDIGGMKILTDEQNSIYNKNSLEMEICLIWKSGRRIINKLNLYIDMINESRLEKCIEIPLGPTLPPVDSLL